MSIAEKIKASRERLAYSQNQLAEKANVSLRTVQRIEGGKSIPRGYTLTVLAKALGMDVGELMEQEQGITEKEKSQIQLINLAILTFLVVPFGNIIFPLLLWRKNRKSAIVNETGKRIINDQIIWTLVSSLVLLITPFAQVLLFNTRPPLVLLF